MNVRNCRMCGRIFNYVAGPPICMQCKDALEKKFQEVKKYVFENPGADIKEVAEVCEVETRQIHQWIREERLQFAEDSPIQIACENCGAMIRTGRFCDKCKAGMANEFKTAMGQGNKPKQPKKTKQQSDGNRMRFL